MVITFLGTGTSQGVPVIACECKVCRSQDSHDKRLRSSIHIEIEGSSFVIDSGPDFRQQALREQIKRLDAILFTHEHKDHVAGLDDVRAFNFIQKKSMPLYATKRVMDHLKKEFAYAFADIRYPGVPEVDVHIIDKEPFMINGVKITPIKVMHYQLPVTAFRIKDFTYITDANHIPEDEMGKIRGTEVLVINSLRKENHISHFSLSQALKVIEEVKPERAYLTHISHQMGLHKKIQAELPSNVLLAYDGLRIAG